MPSSMTESSDTTGATGSQLRTLIFQDKMTYFGKAVGPGKGAVAETFTMEPPVNQGQQHSHNTDPDHHLTLQTTRCDRPTSLLCMLPVRDASTSQPLQDPIDSRHTALMSPPDSLHPDSNRMSFQSRWGRETTRPAARVCLSDTDIAADDRPTEEAEQKENTGTTSDHQGSDVPASNAKKQQRQ